MGIWQDIKGLFIQSENEQRSTLANPAEWMYSWIGGKPTSAGISVTNEKALTQSTVYACIRLLSETFASLPVGLYEDKANTIRRLDGDSRDFLISYEPSQLYTSYSFRFAGMVHLLLDGNFYALILRDGNNRPTELRIIDFNKVTPEFDPDGKLWYKISGEKTPVRPANMLHVKGFSTDGIKGKSPISMFRENIALGLATTMTQGALWKNGTLISGYLKHPGKVSQDQYDQLKESWSSRTSGPNNAGKTPVLENGMEFVPLTLKPQDAMFIETAKLTAKEICAIYGVPLHMVGELDRATNNNIEHQSLEFVRDAVRPNTKNWEQELNRKLVFPHERTTRYFEFNLEGLLRGDTQSRAEYFTRALGSVSNPGWMSPNEVRKIENLNPVDGGDAIYNPTLNNTGDAGQNTTDGSQQQQEPGASGSN